MSYSDFKRCCEKKNMKKIRRTLKAHISGTAWQIQLKFGIKVPHTKEICAENFVCFCSGSVELQMHENGIFLIGQFPSVLSHEERG